MPAANCCASRSAIPRLEVRQATSERLAGQFVHFTHPNLRRRTTLKFSSAASLEPCDLLFLCLPHGSAMARIDQLASLAGRIVDLSADFRLRRAEDYDRWYGKPHANPAWLAKFVYGLPELKRAEIAGAPVRERRRLQRDRVDAGDLAAGGRRADGRLARRRLRGEGREQRRRRRGGRFDASSRARRRHAQLRADRAPPHGGNPAEPRVTRRRDRGASERDRGRQRARRPGDGARVRQTGVAERDVWRAYREAYANEPFVRIVKERTGLYRYPEPKILSGSNYADVGFEMDAESGRVVGLCAIDNLMKGAAGTAVQCVNVMMGWDEALGLEFPGLHPI